MFELQATVFSIIIITVLLIVFLFILNGKLKKFEPMDEPKGLVLLAMVATQTVDKMVRDKTNDKVARYLTPYILSVVLYIFVANISGLLPARGSSSKGLLLWPHRGKHRNP